MAGTLSSTLLSVDWSQPVDDMQCNKGVQISSSSTIGNFRYFTENNNLQNDEIRESLATKPYVLADITNTGNLIF